MRVLLIDNYDSFTFNLYQYVGELLEVLFPNSSLDVVRNDACTAAELESRQYDRIIISPGPGNPANPRYFGVCKDVILKLAQTVPTLAVCLGLQGMAHYYGGRVVPAAQPMHGKTSHITHTGTGVFRDVPNNVAVMRYHSLLADLESIPTCLEVIAVAKTGAVTEVMGLQHTTYPLVGVQFHPESFGTEYGKRLIANFLEQKS